jgi:hypothetical protein
MDKFMKNYASLVKTFLGHKSLLIRLIFKSLKNEGGYSTLVVDHLNKII